MEGTRAKGESIRSISFFLSRVIITRPVSSFLPSFLSFPFLPFLLSFLSSFLSSTIAFLKEITAERDRGHALEEGPPLLPESGDGKEEGEEGGEKKRADERKDRAVGAVGCNQQRRSVEKGNDSSTIQL